VGCSETNGGEMRLKRHINEQEPWDGLGSQHTDGTMSAEHSTFTLFMTNILRDCKPFLKDLNLRNYSFLFSGRKRDTDWFEQKVRNDRKPKDLDKDLHLDFDNEFMKQHGWRARSNGLFCNGSESSAYEYGNTFMIFPKGQYKFLWCDNIGDLFIYIQRETKTPTMTQKGNVLYQHIYNNLANSGEHQPDGDFVDKVTKEYNKFITDTVKKYKSTNINAAIGSHNEIMLNCQTYYAVRYSQWHMRVHEFFKAFGDKMPDTETLREFLR